VHHIKIIIIQNISYRIKWLQNAYWRAVLSHWLFDWLIDWLIGWLVFIWNYIEMRMYISNWVHTTLIWNQWLISQKVVSPRSVVSVKCEFQPIKSLEITLTINLRFTTFYEIDHRYVKIQKIGEQNTIKVFWSKKSREP
jgi:hypothetical protein